MSLPRDFAFSQASLQDYLDCPRRFQLRYVERIAWPAPLADPLSEVEDHLARGVDFHRLVYQHALGIPAEAIREGLQDDKLEGWWDAYLAHPLDLPMRRYPEAAVSTPLAGYRLVAKFDLVAASPGERLVIVDWKTNEGRRPKREWLAKRMQTRVYRYALVEAGGRFNDGAAIEPERVEMIYWFAGFPAQPERLRYSVAEFARDRDDLEALVREIESAVAQAQAGAGELAMASSPRSCRYCRYATLCEREAESDAAADLDEDAEGLAPDAAFDLDLEQVAEVEF